MYMESNNEIHKNRINFQINVNFSHTFSVLEKKSKVLVDDTSNSFNAELVPIFCLTQLKASLNRATEIIVLTCQALSPIPPVVVKTKGVNVP